MGLNIEIPARYNHLLTDFGKVYFAVTDVNVHIWEDGSFRVEYTIGGFPSREAKLATDAKIGIPVFDWGLMPMMSLVDAAIFHYYKSVPLSELFPESMPSDMNLIKEACYEHFKAYLDEQGVEYEDVFEEEVSE